ncbi:MAG: hypothetical protein NZ922_04010 [Candidatus Methanomethyliaceae archaeon]|nr:hypothetical protein [Candidatus Methanomethyliaceae archaeon]MDW7970643.1 hypothetical protein [Nitrososphaerota archaeon]
MEKKFATAINCMDGRVQIPVIDWMKKKYFVEYIDMITEPGPVRILSEGNDISRLNSIRDRLEISIKKHASNIVAIVAHYDCAGNPVEKETQLTQLKSAIDRVKSWNMNVKVLGLWVNEHWNVEEIDK